MFTYIDESLSRFGRYLTSISEGKLVASLATAALPGIAWAFIWRWHNDKYVVEYELPAIKSLPVEDLATVFNALGITRAANGSTLNFEGKNLFPSRPISKKLEKKIDSGRIDRNVDRLVLVPYYGGERVLEVYLSESSAWDDTGISLVAPILDRFMKSRQDAISSQEHQSEAASASIDEALLFDVIHHEIKAWLGKSLGNAHLFLYDARDRMLYHRATGSLNISKDSSDVKKYKPARQAKRPELVKFIESNIDLLEGVSDDLKCKLKLLLGNLSDQDWMRKNAAEHVGELRQLLALLPQEPGTGVAGHTARTGIPEISNKHNETLWDPDAYLESDWFPLMLSVEKLFGIATEGAVAAVPLHESGQLAGVLFVMRNEPFNVDIDTLSLIEKAAQASPLLTLHRNQQFHQALAKAAIENSDKSIAEIFSAEAYRAFNTTYVAHWQFSDRRLDAVTFWGMDRKNVPYAQLRTYPANKGMFRAERIHSKIHQWSQSKEPNLIKRPGQDEQHNWGLPSHEFIDEYERQTGILLRSALVVTPPLTSDVVILYLEESHDVMEQNKTQILQKLAAMQVIERLRAVRKTIKLIKPIGETDSFMNLLDDAAMATECATILIHGPSGSGKSRLARYIHELGGRLGQPQELSVNQDDLGFFNQEAFGVVAEGVIGKFDNEDGTVFIDDIDSANDKIRAALLRVLENREEARRGKISFRRTFTPLGGKQCTRSVQVIATTNRPREELMQGTKRGDMLRRFFEIYMPPLSGRRLDVPLLLRSFIGDQNVIIDAKSLERIMNANFEFDVGTIEDFANTIEVRGIKVITDEIVERYLRVRPGDGEGSKVLLSYGTPYFQPWTGSDEQIHIFHTEAVYPPNPEPKEDWVQFPLRAFTLVRDERQRDGKPQEIDSYVSIGCGAGLDAVAAVSVLRPRSILLTDLSYDVISVARENVLANSGLMPEAVQRKCGSVFEPVPSDFRADLIFENLPVIPEESNKVKSGRLTGTYFARGPEWTLPQAYPRWSLTSHYLFLRDAQRHLTPGGSVICSIGARMPWKLVKQMFEELNYEPELLVYDMKQQEELTEVAGGLAKLEQDEVSFRFYDLDLARKALKIVSVPDTREARLGGFATVHEEADAQLEPLVMSAKEALVYPGRIGHMVYIVRGTPRNDPDLA
jgi:methylase of polypeptide subunit release factors